MNIFKLNFIFNKSKFVNELLVNFNMADKIQMGETVAYSQGIYVHLTSSSFLFG